MLTVNKPLVIKTSSQSASKWVQRLKDNKAKQLELMRRVATLEKELA